MTVHRALFYRLLRILLITTAFGLSTNAIAQKKVKLKQADVAKGGKKNGDRYERLLGNVIFTQNKTTIFCDSAHFYKKQNSLEAYGKVKITEGDSVNITGRKLEYDGDKKLAKMRSNVVFTKLATATLYTDNLDYARATNIAYYFSGGKLVDSTNTLTSTTGYYNVNNNVATFKKNVKVVNPDNTMTADSLRYNSRTKMIYFISKTTVVGKDSATSVFEKGTYNTTTKKSDLKIGTGESQQYSIKSRDYDLDALRSIYKARGNVVMTHKLENLLIYGQASDYFKNIGLTKVYDKAYVAKVAENNDTLFMRADTLFSIDNADPSKRILQAYHNVRIFKSDLQGTADSMIYKSADSTIYFYKKPVLWSQGNQLSADSIRMVIKNNTIDKIYLYANAFVISTDTLLNFNQIKGRKMTADVRNGKIYRVYVEGNGESVYFVLDDKTKLLMGMNKIICSNITIRFKDGQVNNFSAYVKPDANFIPPHELKKEDMTLKGFNWKEKEKPTREDVVNYKPKAVEEKKDAKPKDVRSKDAKGKKSKSTSEKPVNTSPITTTKTPSATSSTPQKLEKPSADKKGLKVQ